MATHDLVIRGGTIVDGTGAPAFKGDIAIDGDRITAVGTVAGDGREEYDATGLLVTPGFVDIHTHYDAQATWDPWLTPSSQHGVTTVVIGNCGVGFAPVKPEARNELIDLMEAVEDIPGAAMHEGIKWEWEASRISRCAGQTLLRRRHRHADAPLRAARLCHGRARHRQ